MALRSSKFRGKVKIRGRPKEQATAEIMLMKAENSLKQKQRRALFFILLDTIIIISFGIAIYSFYHGNILNGFLTLIVGLIILIYFLMRRFFKKTSRKLKKMKNKSK